MLDEKLGIVFNVAQATFASTIFENLSKEEVHYEKRNAFKSRQSRKLKMVGSSMVVMISRFFCFKFDAFEHDVYLEQFMERLNFFEEGNPTRPNTDRAKLVTFSITECESLANIPSHISPFQHHK